MKKRRMTSLLLGLLTGLLLCALSGCSILPPLFPSQVEESAPAALELHLGCILPENVVLTWDPEAVAVDKAEVSVTEGGSNASRTVTVTIQLYPAQP